MKEEMEIGITIVVLRAQERELMLKILIKLSPWFEKIFFKYLFIFILIFKK